MFFGVFEAIGDALVTGFAYTVKGMGDAFELACDAVDGVVGVVGDVAGAIF